MTNRAPESAQNVQDGDLISRKAAIEAVEKHFRAHGDNDLLEVVSHDIERLPSAQPDRAVMDR